MANFFHCCTLVTPAGCMVYSPRSVVALLVPGTRYSMSPRISHSAGCYADQIVHYVGIVKFRRVNNIDSASQPVEE